jgi:hypothetical protein
MIHHPFGYDYTSHPLQQYTKFVRFFSNPMNNECGKMVALCCGLVETAASNIFRF